MNLFEQELVKRVRGLPDEILIEVAREHLDSVLGKPREAKPTRRKRGQRRRGRGRSKITAKKTEIIRGISHTHFSHDDQLFLMWETSKGFTIQDEKSRRRKTRHSIKVYGKTRVEAERRLRKLLVSGLLEK